MKTTIKERCEVISRLQNLGFTYEEANQLRRISMTLRNWFELECGTGDRVTKSIERAGDNGDGKPFLRVQYQGPTGWVDRKLPVLDREAGARKRLATIMAGHKGWMAYVQGDPRGCALYILSKADLRGQNVEQVYNRGVAVY